MRKTLLYLNTMRYLKPSQLYWQCIRRIYHPKVLLNIKKFDVNFPLQKWRGAVNRNDCYFIDNSLVFLNKAVQCDQNFWTNCKKEAGLWQYNLHYFNGLLSNDLNTRTKMVALLTAWIQAFP